MSPDEGRRQRIGAGPRDPMPLDFPQLGHGVGLRPKHYGRFLEATPPVDFVEVISENYFAQGGRPLHVLERVRRELPVVLHGVALSIGSTDPLSAEYLRKLGALVARIEPAMVSDHLCFGSHRGQYVHDLLPLPYTEESLAHVVERVKVVQDALGRQILLENPSSYVAFRQSTLTEWDFLAEVARRADCGILLDVNNVFVSARNLGGSAEAYVDAFPGERVMEVHLAGHSADPALGPALLVDSHDAPVAAEVWALYERLVARIGPRPTLIERDASLPAFSELMAERATALDVLRGRLEKAA